MKAEDIDLDFDDRVSYSKPSVQPKTRPNKDKNFDEKAEMNMQPSITSKAQPRNTEKASIKNIRLDNKAKTAIQIIKYDSYNRFELNEEAEEVFFFNLEPNYNLFV